MYRTRHFVGATACTFWLNGVSFHNFKGILKFYFKVVHSGQQEITSFQNVRFWSTLEKINFTPHQRTPTAIFFKQSKLCNIQLPIIIVIRSKEIPAFYGTYNLLACSKEIATGAYLETAESHQISPPYFPNNTTNIIFPLHSIHSSCNNAINLSTKLSLWTAPHLVLGSNHWLLTVGGAGFEDRTVHVGFMVDKVTARQTILSESPCVPLSVSFHQGSTRIHLSSTLYIIISLQRR